MEGRIPDEILWMPGKDMGPPIGDGRNITAPTIRSIHDLPEAVQDLLDPSRLDRLIEDVARSGRTSQDKNIQIKRLILYNIEMVSKWLGG